MIPQGALQSLAKMSSVERDGLVDQLISFASIYHNILNNTEQRFPNFCLGWPGNLYFSPS